MNSLTDSYFRYFGNVCLFSWSHKCALSVHLIGDWLSAHRLSRWVWVKMKTFDPPCNRIQTPRPPTLWPVSVRTELHRLCAVLYYRTSTSLRSTKCSSTMPQVVNNINGQSRVSTRLIRCPLAILSLQAFWRDSTFRLYCQSPRHLAQRQHGCLSLRYSSVRVGYFAEYWLF